MPQPLKHLTKACGVSLVFMPSYTREVITLTMTAITGYCLVFIPSNTSEVITVTITVLLLATA